MVPERNFDNQKLSALQQAILAAKGPPIGNRIGHLPRTGDVTDGVSRRRDKAGFASVSRALSRLWQRGLVDAYVGEPALECRRKSCAGIHRRHRVGHG